MQIVVVVFIIFITIISVLIGFLTGGGQVGNPLIAYITTVALFFIDHFLLFLIGFCITVFLFARRQSVTQAISQTIFALIIGIFAGFVVLSAIAWIQITSISFIARFDPGALGIVTNTNTIYKNLQKNNKPPLIIASEPYSQRILVGITQAISGTTNVYGSAIIAGLPDFLIFPSQTFPNLILVDNVLVVSKIEQKDMQTIAPLIGYLFVQEYFPNRQIKHFPHASIMSEAGFTSYREADAKEKLHNVTLEIQKMDNAVATISAGIQKDTDAIDANDTDQKSALKQQSLDYDTCLSEGTYNNGVFQPSHTKDFCQTVLDSWKGKLDDLNKESLRLSQQLVKDQQMLKNYQYYDNFFKAEKELMPTTTDSIPSELGVFVPPDSIKVVVASKNAHSIADFFETLCHEYLHYASFVQGKRLDSIFFEEGFTEYFARQTIKDNLQIDINIGYPIAVKIVKAITNRIAEPDLADIYFTKDQAGLEKILDLTYGDNFYADNITFFESLQYTSDATQALQLANFIMNKIGGNPLTEKDLMSSQSNY